METDEISILQGEEDFLCKQLEQIFPNHDQLVIRRTVVNVSKHVDFLDGSLEICIEELINIPHTGPKQNASKMDSKVLSHIQGDVMSDLKQIFQNYDDRIIKTSVCHPSNLFEPLVKQALLQRCIDDLLDGRTAAEAGVDNDIGLELIAEDDADFEAAGLGSENCTPNLDDDEFASVTEITGVKMEFPTTKPDRISIGDDSENSCGSQTAPALKQKSSIGFTVADISLTEKTSSADMKYPAVPPIKNTSKSATEVQSEKPDDADKKIEKETSDPNISVPLSDRSSVFSKDDVFSCRTIEFSDSDMSEASSCSIDSQQDDDDLPQISFPKTVHLHHDEVLRSPIRGSRDVKLPATATNSHVPTAFPSPVCSGDIDSATNFKIKPTKFTFSSNSNQLTGHTGKNDPVFPYGNGEKVQVPKNSWGINTPDNGSSSHAASRTIQGLKTPRSSGNQQTVTIESTHTIIYNNPTPENVIRQSQCGNMAAYRGARPNYCPNITVKLPLDPPQLEFRDTSSQLSAPRTIYGNKNPANSATISKAPDDYDKKEPRTNSVLRPSVLSNHGDIGAAGIQRSVTSVMKPAVTTMAAQALGPELAFRNTPFGTIPPGRDRQNVAASVIPLEPIDLELDGPNHPVILIPEDNTAEQLTIQPAEVVLDIANDNNAPVVLDIANDNNAPVVLDIADDNNAPMVFDIADDNIIPMIHEIADDNNAPVVLDIADDNIIPVIHEIADDNTIPVVHDIAADKTIPVKTDVLNLFPDVDPAHLDTLCQQHTGHMAVNNICLQLLENEYPKNTEKKSRSSEKSETVANVESTSIDYYKDYQHIVLPEYVIIKYQAQAFQILAQEFLWLSANDIKSVMRKVKNFYSPSYKALQTVWSQAVDIVQKKRTSSNSPLVFRGLVFQANIPSELAGGMNCRMSVKLLKNRRPIIKVHFDIVPELQKEVDFVKRKLKDSETEADHKVAVALNEQEYEDQGQCIECGCCYGEYPFEQMVQCYDGHLFCENCLKQYAKESVFGQGKADLICMTELCDSTFPKSQLMKAIPPEILVRYEDRVTEENLNLADLGDLVKCPHCEFRAFMDPADKVFRCHNDHCKKESCRYCEVAWEEHFGKKCSEVEKKDETKLRLEYEEKMTKAKVRVCHRCKAQFMKLDGCNKMTCRCGGKMCYICRQPNIDYNHFCRHPRDPGKECTSCKACNLWTNPEEDDNRAIIEMQKEAEEERKKKGYTEARVIGVPDQPPAKKVKR